MSKQLTPRLNRLEPNIVIDGGMEIWPEGTSRSVANNTTAYGAVLFKCTNTNSGISLTNSRQSSIPSNTNLVYSNQTSKTAAGTLAASTEIFQSYVVEGYDVDKIFKNNFSLIFWVKSSVASSRSIALRTSSNSHSLVKQYSISQANVWELKVLTFDALNTCPGTINRDNSAGVKIAFNIVSGSTIQTSTVNTWQAGNFISGVGEDTTWLTGTNHDFSIAGVMILPGDWTSLTASLYDFLRAGRNFQQEESMTKRYYEINGHSTADVGNASGVLGALGRVNYSVEKRATPTLTITGNGSPNQVRNDNNGATEGTVSVGSSDPRGHQARSTSALSDNIQYSYQWVADARF